MGVDRVTAISRDVMNVFILVDKSWSMQVNSTRIEQVNNALPELRNSLAEFSEDNNVEVRLRVISFSDDITWEVGSVSEGVLPADVNFKEIKAENRTNTALAINAVNECLSPSKLGILRGGHAFKPVVILITDGLTTSTKEDYTKAIETMKTKLAGSTGKDNKIIRIAIGVEDAKEEELVQFATVGDIGEDENVPFAFNVTDARNLAKGIIQLTETSMYSSITDDDDDVIVLDDVDWVSVRHKSE